MARRVRELTPEKSARHLFGAEIRRRREQAGMTLDGLSEVVRYSRSHLSRIEIADYVPPPDLAAKLDAAFGTDGLFERIYALARHEVHPDQYRRRMEMEAQARVIHEYAGQFVPGLVQTEAYARTLFRVGDPRRTEDKVAEMLAARLNRQALLKTERAPDFACVLDEAVLRRPVGGPSIWREQLAALIAIVDTPTTTVQVLPFEHGEHALMGGSLALFIAEDGHAIAYEESNSTGQLLEDPEVVSRRRRAYDRLRSYALSPNDSAAFIRHVMEELPS
ncbi:helix-turn-helix transcriptional regulator [Streptomyces triculaminicus]|uniref:Helix-turn-helix transcriptional regulator n=2 Tax=Streptomyces TaxID=1883 RepID=A0A939JPT7_9ACTN|nr:MULTISPECIES: helix-turn-helix transcriptional regulator [Streptomyces]MBO0651854.1 helix-turn-helix transcriptional regulator [Streptomyces triculaminicus]QSY47221.1 helix-turn-helix transcriptional regulator [Streptomyces griseocarneus]